MNKEIIYDIYWEGPFDWDIKSKKVKPHHVLYQIYGFHHLYGNNVLLYIGTTSHGINRIKDHEYWIEEEYDNVEIRVGSVREFTGWEGWKKPVNYPKPQRKLVEKVEALLIYAHQPVYNMRNKQGANTAKNIRIFNTGKPGSLFPELSAAYFLGI